MTNAPKIVGHPTRAVHRPGGYRSKRKPGHQHHSSGHRDPTVILQAGSPAVGVNRFHRTGRALLGAAAKMHLLPMWKAAFGTSIAPGFSDTAR
jgi:hypothetical protein